MKDEIKVGIFTLIGVAIFVFSLIILGDLTFERRYSIYVVFDNIGGLASKSPVKLNGVEVGKIKSVSFEGKNVVAEISVNENIKIYRNSKFYIASTSVIGSKFLQIEQGEPSSGIINPGEKVFAISRKPIEDVIFDVAENLNDLIKSLNSNGQIAKNLNDAVKNLRDITANLNAIISRNASKIDKITDNTVNMFEDINKLTVKLDGILDKIEKGQGTIGTLISDEKTAKDIKETFSNVKEATKQLKEYTSKASQVKIYWKWEYKYEPNARESFNDVGLKFKVNEHKYYYVGASNIINIKNRPRGISYETKNTVDAYIGWDYDNWGFYIGAIRGTGGLGLKYKIVDTGKKGSIYAETEINEFSRNRYIKQRYFNDARYDFGLRYNLDDKISASVKLTDIFEVKRLNISTRVIFEDKDIAYLLGLAGAGSSAILLK